MIALLAILLAAPPAETVSVRLTTGEELTGELVSGDADGIVLRLQGPTEPYERFIRWTHLDDASRLAVRASVYGEVEPGPAQPARAGARQGVRVVMGNGDVWVGWDSGLSDTATLRLRTARGIEALSRGEIASAEPVTVPLSAVLGPQEMYQYLVDEEDPAGPEDWERIAQTLQDNGVDDWALTALRISHLLRSGATPHGGVYGRLARLREMLAGAAPDVEIGMLSHDALAGRYEEAVRHIEEISRGEVEPFVREELERIRVELEMMRDMAAEARVIEEFDGAIETRLHLLALDREAGLEETARRVREEIQPLIEADVAERAGFTPGDASLRDLWAARPADRRRVHAYGSASWIVDRIGTMDADAWWAEADSAARLRLLQGIYIERHMDLIRSESQNCPECGAAGRVTIPAGREVVCPTCRGTHTLRVLVYR